MPCGSVRAVFQSSLSLFLSLCLITGQGIAANGASPQGGGIRVNVVQGDGQTLVIGSGITREIAVQVLDSSGRPVANANVSFVLGNGGSTDDGLSSSVVSTGSSGAATIRVRPNSQAGVWSIRVTASFQQQINTATISLTNVAEAPRALPPTPPTAEGGAGAPGAAPMPPEVRGSPGPVTPPVAKKTSHTGLIVLLLIAGAGGGVGAALAMKGKSSIPPTPTRV